jgi:hypothetical protein
MPRRISIVAAARRYIVKLTPQKAYCFMAEADKWRPPLVEPHVTNAPRRISAYRSALSGKDFWRGKVNATPNG